MAPPVVVSKSNVSQQRGTHKRGALSRVIPILAAAALLCLVGIERHVLHHGAPWHHSEQHVFSRDAVASSRQNGPPSRDIVVPPQEPHAPSSSSSSFSSSDSRAAREEDPAPPPERAAPEEEAMLTKQQPKAPPPKTAPVLLAAANKAAEETSPKTTSPLQWERGVFRPETFGTRESDAPVPQVVRAFRNGNIDWHDLLPAHSSLWSRFGESTDTPKFDFMKLVLKETAVTDFLTQYDASGLAREYGTNHGPLADYASCNLVKDACLAHDRPSCDADALCAWRQQDDVCAAVPITGTEEKEPSREECPAPVALATDQGDRVVPADKGPSLSVRGEDVGFFDLFPVTNLTLCETFVTAKTLAVEVDGDAATMFFHWWRFFKQLFAKLKLDASDEKIRSEKRASHSRNLHFLIKNVGNTQFFHYFGLLSDNCWRRLGGGGGDTEDKKKPNDVPRRACFCDVEVMKTPRDRQRSKSSRLSSSSSSSRIPEASDAKVLEAVVGFLGLDAQPAPTRVRVGLISRRRKRFLLNENDLVDAVLALGYECQLLPLEAMTLYEQVAALRHVTILVGIHGSGLNNAVFLRRGAALVQLLPYKLNYKGAFEANAKHAGVAYREWTATDATKSRFHWEFLGPAEMRAGKDDVLRRGSPTSGPEVYTFWINQDIIVPVDEFVAVLQDAIAASPLNQDLIRQKQQQQRPAVETTTTTTGVD